MKIGPVRTHFRDALEFFLSTNVLSKKIFKRNRSIVFNRAVTRKINEYYNGDDGHNINHAYGGLGYGFIHYAFIINSKPKNILCIGSRKGFVPAVCALACQENEFGHVDFVDAGYDEKTHPQKAWSGIGWWKKIDPKKHFSLLDLQSYISTHVMTTKEFASKSHTQYMYIYIDGDHSYEGVKKDYELFWPRLEKGGFMIFHDIVVKKQPNSPPFGVWKFWKEITKTNKNSIVFIEPRYSGLGIIQKT